MKEQLFNIYFRMLDGRKKYDAYPRYLDYPCDGDFMRSLVESAARNQAQFTAFVNAFTSFSRVPGSLALEPSELAKVGALFTGFSCLFRSNARVFRRQ